MDHEPVLAGLRRLQILRDGGFRGREIPNAQVLHWGYAIGTAQTRAGSNRRAETLATSSHSVPSNSSRISRQNATRVSSAEGCATLIRILNAAAPNAWGFDAPLLKTLVIPIRR